MDAVVVTERVIVVERRQVVGTVEVGRGKQHPIEAAFGIIGSERARVHEAERTPQAPDTLTFNYEGYTFSVEVARTEDEPV